MSLSKAYPSYKLGVCAKKKKEGESTQRISGDKLFPIWYKKLEAYICIYFAAQQVRDNISFQFEEYSTVKDHYILL